MNFVRCHIRDEDESLGYSRTLGCRGQRVSEGHPWGAADGLDNKRIRGNLEDIEDRRDVLDQFPFISNQVATALKSLRTHFIIGSASKLTQLLTDTMDGWMDGWTDGTIDSSIDGWMDG